MLWKNMRSFIRLIITLKWSCSESTEKSCWYFVMSHQLTLQKSQIKIHRVLRCITHSCLYCIVMSHPIMSQLKSNCGFQVTKTQLWSHHCISLLKVTRWFNFLSWELVINNYHDDFITVVLNHCHTRVTRWLHCKVTRKLFRECQSWHE